MGQYLQFRSWTRNSTGGEKGLAATAAVVVVALTGWALLPTSSGEDTLAGGDAAVLQGEAVVPGGAADATTGAVGTVTGAAGTTGGGAPGTTGGGAAGTTTGGAAGTTTGGAPGTTTGGAAGTTTGGAPGTTTGGAPGTTTGGAPGRATGPAPCTGASREVGVTPTTINMAAVTINLGGAIGNSAIGLASTEQQEKMSNAVIAEINSKGGVCGRKIAVTYFEANPIDANTSARACLRIAEGKFYAVIDLGGFSFPPGANDCPPQRKIPLFTGAGPLPSQQKQHGPYFMSYGTAPVPAAVNSILSMARLGYFDPKKGFKKLGMFYDDCFPEVNKAVFDALDRVGIKKGSISEYRFNCPGGGFASGQGEQAVLQHQQDGVTHVIPLTGGGSFQPYSRAAKNSNFKPTYTVTDLLGFPVTTTGATGPDRDNFDGTVMVSSTKIGMTQEFVDQPTKDCQATFKRAGVDPAWVTGPFLGGAHCNHWRTFAAAASNVPGSLARVNLAEGLARVGRMPMAMIGSDAVFGPGKPYGGDFSWPMQYQKACNCWVVLDRTPNPILK